jgi:hypothetical protein
VLVSAFVLQEIGNLHGLRRKPLRPEDFPADSEDQKIKKQDGTPIADAESPGVAAEIAERLNEDEARREEDKWSA